MFMAMFRTTAQSAALVPAHFVLMEGVLQERLVLCSELYKVGGSVLFQVLDALGPRDWEHIWALQEGKQY
jgi:hypothetical protein